MGPLIAAAGTADTDPTAAVKAGKPSLLPLMMELNWQSSSSSSRGQVATDPVGSDVQLMCTSRGAFVPLTSCSAAGATAAAAAAEGDVVYSQVFLGVPASHTSGLLTLHAEQTVNISAFLNSSGTGNGGSCSREGIVDAADHIYSDLSLQHDQTDPVPIKGSPFQILACTDNKVIAEVSGVLLGSAAVASSEAGLLLQQLGLLMDCWAMQQQQQQQQGGITREQVQWRARLLTSGSYLAFVR
jgi:hypothetical protein